MRPLNLNLTNPRTRKRVVAIQRARKGSAASWRRIQAAVAVEATEKPLQPILEASHVRA